MLCFLFPCSEGTRRPARSEFIFGRSAEHAYSCLSVTREETLKSLMEMRFVRRLRVLGASRVECAGGEQVKKGKGKAERCCTFQMLSGADLIEFQCCISRLRAK
jgi:hypothetical protein